MVGLPEITYSCRVKREDSNMKLLKRLFILLVTAIILSGCSAKSDPDIDINSLCNELLDKAGFEDELSSVDEDVIKQLYDIEDYSKAQVYISSGATAEEIAVFQFGNCNLAKEGFKKAQNRIEEQKQDYETYVPKEVKKLEDALVERHGSYVIVCVSNSDEAEKIVNQYVEK